MQSKGQEQDINKSCRYGKNQQNHLKNHSQAYTFIFLMNVKWFLQCPEQLWIRLIIDHLFYPLQFYWTIQFLKYLIDLSRVVYTEPNVSCNESFGSRHLRFLERPSQKKKQQRETIPPSNTSAWESNSRPSQPNPNIMYYQRNHKTESAKTSALITDKFSCSVLCPSLLLDGWWIAFLERGVAVNEER